MKGQGGSADSIEDFSLARVLNVNSKAIRLLPGIVGTPRQIDALVCWRGLILRCGATSWRSARPLGSVTRTALPPGRRHRCGG